MSDPHFVGFWMIETESDFTLDIIDRRNEESRENRKSVYNPTVLKDLGPQLMQFVWVTLINFARS